MSTQVLIEQVALAVFGVVSIWLSQSPLERWRRWAPIWGLCGEPFWFIASVREQQWGVFALTVVFTICWLRGLHTYWWRRR
jgi:hypothetical protein